MRHKSTLAMREISATKLIIFIIIQTIIKISNRNAKIYIKIIKNISIIFSNLILQHRTMP